MAKPKKSKAKKTAVKKAKKGIRSVSGETAKKAKKGAAKKRSTKGGPRQCSKCGKVGFNARTHPKHGAA
jgi:hypothetical protein